MEAQVHVFEHRGIALLDTGAVQLYDDRVHPAFSFLGFLKKIPFCSGRER